MDISAPRVGIVMGSRSDWQTMRHAADTLASLGVTHETRIVSAHRTPQRLYAYAGRRAAAACRSSLPGRAGLRICPA